MEKKREDKTIVEIQLELLEEKVKKAILLEEYEQAGIIMEQIDNLKKLNERKNETL